MRFATLIDAESPRTRRSRRTIVTASTTVLVGLALVGLRPSDPGDTAFIDVGMVITLVSLVLFIAGIHFYGRLGPVDPSELRDDRSSSAASSKRRPSKR